MHKIFCFLATLSFSQFLSASWSDPVDIYSAKIIQAPAVDIDASGNAMIMATVSTDMSLFYTQSARLFQGNPTDSHAFSTIGRNQGINTLSVNDSGNAVLAWLEFNQSVLVRSAVWIDGSWSLPATISDVTTSVVQDFLPPRVSLNNSDRALCLWPCESPSDGSYHLQTNRFDGTSWKLPQSIVNSSNFITSTALAGTSSGSILAAWCKGSPATLQSAYFTDTLQSITDLSNDVFDTRVPISDVAINSSGQGIILWNSSQGLSSIFFNQGSYQPAQLLFTSSENEEILSAAVAINDSGTAMAVWTLSNPENSAILMASSNVNNHWQTPLQLDKASSNDAISFIDLAVDKFGNVYVVWESDNANGNGTVFYNRFSHLTQSWMKEPNTLSNPQESATQTSFAMNPEGNVVVIWTIGEEGNQTIQAVYTHIQPDPPINFRGMQIEKRHFCKKEWINILQWNASDDPLVVSYRLYRDGIEIATTTTTQYKDRHRKKGYPYHYKLTSVDENGVESSPVHFTFH